MDEGNYRILRYKQYDNNNILKIIIQENKEEVDLDFYTARLFFKLPSGSILEKDTTIENNKIVVSIDSGILSENGRVIVDLTLSSSEQLVTAFTMYLDVEETIDRNEAVQSKPEWDLITNTLNNLDKKVDKVEGKSLIANSEIERLANVDNYDDTELRNLIDTKSDTTHNHDTQYASKSNEHTHDNKNALDKITDLKVIEWDNKSDFSGSYEDLTDKPTISTPDVNKAYVDEQLSNKSDINHTHTELHTHNNKDVLDTITQEKINEWNSQSDFSGDYNDLINKPTIPTLDGYATESYVKNAIADAQLNGGGGTGSIDLSGYATKDELNAKANVSDIPTKVSELENDSKFLTSVPSEYVTETELNAKGYLTEHQDISGKVDKVVGKSLISDSEIERLANMEDNANNYVHPSTHEASMIVEDNTHRFITDLERVNWNNKVESSQLHEHSNKDVLDGITSDKVAKWDKAEENVQSDWNITDTTSDAYIKNKPSIPSKVSELTNDNLYATETYVQNKIAEAQIGGDIDLSEYALKVDLDEKVDKVSGKGLSTNDYTNEEKDKLSNLSTIATSGSYNDLIDKPTIPTKTSELTNDSSFASESYVTNAINNAQLGGGDGSSIDLSAYQTKSDDTLITDSKTIVGAINELDTKSIKSVNYSTIDTTIENDVSNRLTELETNKADKTYVDEQISNVSIDLSDYQTKNDTTLETTNKTIVGAINEVYNDTLIQENVKYTTTNGIKEFSCKDGYIDNVVIEGETLVNCKIPGTCIWDGSENRLKNVHMQHTLLKANNTYTLFNLSSKVIDINLLTLPSTWENSIVCGAKSSTTFVVGANQQLGVMSGWNVHGWDSTMVNEFNNSIVILEGDHTDKPISYFEGLKSVGQGDKIEVLSYSGERVDYGSLTFTNGIKPPSTGMHTDNRDWKYSSYIKVNPNTGYLLKNVSINVNFYDINKNIIPRDYQKFLVENIGDTSIGHIYIKTPSNCEYIIIHRRHINTTPIEMYTVSLYDKKQISTTLRSLPNGVKDTIEKRGNKYVKVQRCGEVTLNGNEQVGMYENNGNTAVFGVVHKEQTHKRGLGICDKFRYHMVFNTGEEHFYLETDNAVNIEISLSKLSSVNEEGLKAWLKSNPITIVYELETPIITELPNFNPQTFEGSTTLLINSGVIQANADFEVTNSLGSDIEVMKNKLSDIYDYVDRELVSEAKRLKNILISKNIEITEDECKLSSLIDKVDLLGEYDDGKLWLYKEGDEYTDVTGGFVPHRAQSNPPTLTKTSSYMEYKAQSGSYTSGHYGTNSPIDITDYSLLKFEVETLNMGSTHYGCNFGLTTKKDMDSSVAAIQITTNKSKHIISLDISSISGLNYVYSDTTYNNTSRIYKIWLEK